MAPQQLQVEGIAEQALHHRRSALQVFHGFEQGHHQQAGAPGLGIHQAGLLGQQQHLQQVGHRVTHRDHVALADPLSEFLLQAVQHAEDLEGFGSCCAPVGGWGQ